MDKQVVNQELLEGTLEKHKTVFDRKNRMVARFKTKLQLKENAHQVFCKARPLPYASDSVQI